MLSSTPFRLCAELSPTWEKSRSHLGLGLDNEERAPHGFIRTFLRCENDLRHWQMAGYPSRPRKLPMPRLRLAHVSSQLSELPGMPLVEPGHRVHLRVLSHPVPFRSRARTAAESSESVHGRHRTPGPSRLNRITDKRPTTSPSRKRAGGLERETSVGLTQDHEWSGIRLVLTA